jgi:hypothetical protein
MSSAKELTVTAIYSKLSTDSTLANMLADGVNSVFHLSGPKDSTFPYVVYSWHDGGDENETQSDSYNWLWFIRAYANTPAGAATAGTIHDRIKALLHNGTLTVTGYTTVTIELYNDYEASYMEDDGSQSFVVGGLYRIILDN